MCVLQVAMLCEVPAGAGSACAMNGSGFSLPPLSCSSVHDASGNERQLAGHQHCACTGTAAAYLSLCIQSGICSKCFLSRDEAQDHETEFQAALPAEVPIKLRLLGKAFQVPLLQQCWLLFSPSTLPLSIADVLGLQQLKPLPSGHLPKCLLAYAPMYVLSMPWRCRAAGRCCRWRQAVHDCNPCHGASAWHAWHRWTPTHWVQAGPSLRQDVALL